MQNSPSELVGTDNRVKIGVIALGLCGVLLLGLANTNFSFTPEADASACQLSDENLKSIQTGQTTLPKVRSIFGCEGTVTNRWSANGRANQDVVFKAGSRQVRVWADGDVIGYMTW